MDGGAAGMGMEAGGGGRPVLVPAATSIRAPSGPVAVVRVSKSAGLGVLTLSGPPVNALNGAMRAALAAALEAVAADEAVRAIALAGDGRMFSAGLDVREIGTPGAGSVGAPDLAALCAALSSSRKPVVAVLDGPALGAGAELALAARWRIGTARARMAFSDLALGLIPGAGGTQRLPRLVGAERAATLLLERTPVGAEAMRRMGLLDGLVEGDALAAVPAVLRALAARETDRPSPRTVDARGALRALARARAGLQPSQVTERDLVDCVEAALLLPPEQGMAFEAVRHEVAVTRPQARALRHLFMAERLAPPTLLARTPGGGRVIAPAGEALVERLGRAMGRAAGALVRAGTPRAAVDAALVGWGLPAGPFGGERGETGPGPTALVRRINAAVAVEGARLVAEGLARPGDVDALAVAGLGVPRVSGGPMALAEIQGLAALVRDMGPWAALDPVWAAPPLMAEAARRDAWPAA